MKFDINWLKEEPLSNIPKHLLEEAKMRQCRTCHKKKDKECFYKSIGNSTGYSKQCKSCSRQYARDRRNLKKENK